MSAPKRDSMRPVVRGVGANWPAADNALRSVTPLGVGQPTRVPRDTRPYSVGDAVSSVESVHGITRDDAALVLLVLALLGGTNNTALRSPDEARLSRRQREVIRLVARGMTNVQVAESLFISPRTVERHLTTIYHKLGISSRNAATRYAIQHGLG